MRKLFEVTHVSGKTGVYIFGKKIVSFQSRLIPYQKLKSKPKFCVSYSVFDGEELLEASIKSIRQEVDYINVVYQTTSWVGNLAAPSLLQTLKEIQVKGLIDELIFFEPDLSLDPQTNEREKRNVGLKAAIKAGGNYFMTMDTDEFYFSNELRKVKDAILKKGITHSYCAQLAYIKKPTSRLVNNYGCYLQIFSKIDKFSLLGVNKFAVCLVDPTRMILERKNSKHFVFNDIQMHHMYNIRLHISKKYANSSGQYYAAENGSDPSFDVENYFNINLPKS